ncbi:hypothetical protein BJ878DRAFT_545272 [Calycina marina]|uniref:Uncharacterized protein n=1 Tax=Calycina marina TaxID=1763456 RepID=A0A9P7YX29_9HELO|nr:hypothetical protein BJ878DRAFT_545272 [Calycina marina]
MAIIGAAQPGNSFTPQSSGHGQVAGQPGDTGNRIWDDEERIENALKVLKEMHIQVRQLRSVIPRFMAPLGKPQPSPEVLFLHFSASVSSAQQEILTFRHLVRDGETVEIFKRAKTSREEKPEGIKPWKVTEHPDWLTRDK